MESSQCFNIAFVSLGVCGFVINDNIVQVVVQSHTGGSLLLWPHLGIALGSDNNFCLLCNKKLRK